MISRIERTLLELLMNTAKKVESLCWHRIWWLKYSESYKQQEQEAKHNSTVTSVVE